MMRQLVRAVREVGPSASRRFHAATVCNPNAFAMLLPRSAGLPATSTPHPRSASIFACAGSLVTPAIVAGPGGDPR
jgi:hypothetical protein